MSFFNLSDGSNAKDVGTEFAATADLKPIPAKTTVTAVCDKAEWSEYQGERYVSLRWGILKPTEYENRKLFQKIKVYEKDPNKADKAKRMLGAILNNAGTQGLKLLELGREPSTEELETALNGKLMNLTLGVWAIKNDETGETGETKQGNWVQAVAAKGPVVATLKQAPKPPIAEEDIGF